MPNYIAMLRGIGPGNPNMHGDKLRDSFESMGLTNVKTLLSSGNIVFSSEQTNIKKIETLIEDTNTKRLGFTRDAVVRSQKQIQTLIDANPFNDLKHENGGKTYLTITFFKGAPKSLPAFPFTPEGEHFELIEYNASCNAIYSVVDLSKGQTTDLMAWLEREYGKQITTRTWLTMNRILTKLIAIA